MKHEITAHLSELAAQLHRYVPEFDSSDRWICITDGPLKVEFNQKPLQVSGSYYTEHPKLTKGMVKTLKPFATTYLCESGF